MPSSGNPISLGDARTVFGDSGDTRMSELYRGGSLVPSVRNTTTAVWGSFTSFVYNNAGAQSTWVWWAQLSTQYNVYWYGVEEPMVFGTPTSPLNYNFPTRQYERGTYQGTSGYDQYSVRRRDQTTTTTSENINTFVPSSGQISLSQLYGAVDA